MAHARRTLARLDAMTCVTDPPASSPCVWPSERASLDQFPRPHETRRPRLASHRDSVSDGSRIAALAPSRSSGARRRRAVPWPTATDSRVRDGYRNRLRPAFAVFQPLGKYAQGEDLGAGRGLIARSAIGKYTRQLGYLRHPAAIILAFSFDFELHDVDPAVRLGDCTRWPVALP